MTIYINGEIVDLKASEVSMHFGNMRFTDVLADTFSTDLEFPLTVRNVRIFDAYGLIDRPEQLFGNRIACDAVTRFGTFHGSLSVSKISDSTLTATLYLAELPTEFSQRICPLIVDDGDTIINMQTWIAAAYEQTGATSFGRKTYYDTVVSGLPVMPNVRLSSLIERIASAVGVSIGGLPNDDLRLVATRFKVCPQVQRQIVLWNNDTVPSILRAGQHICNRVDTSALTIEFNRECTVSIKAYVQSSVSGSLDIQRRSDDVWQTVATINLRTQGEQSFAALTLNAGEALRLYGSALAVVMLDMTVTGYDITDADYDVDLVYDAAEDYSTPAFYTGGGGYVYFGIMVNLPALTVRELLSAIAWKLGQVLEFDGETVTFADATRSEEIDARIMTYYPTSAQLGQSNVIEDVAGNMYRYFSIPNAQLTERKVVHKTPFALLNAKQHTSGSWAVIDLFEHESPALFKGMNGAALCVAKTTGGTVYLAPTSNPTFLGLDTISRIGEIEAWTLEDLRHLDYLFIEGHKYMLIEGDIDEQSGITTFNALLI